MALIKIPRITTAQRTPLVLEVGEIVFDTDLQQFYGGDGTTAGGISIGGTPTASTIKTLYESNVNTNAFTDAEQAKLSNISVTQAVDLDTIESDTAANNAKVSADGSIATHSDVTLLGISDGDILIYNNATSTFEAGSIPAAPVLSVNAQTGAIVLNADDIDDTTTLHKFVSLAERNQISTNQSNIAQEIVDRTAADSAIQLQVTVNNSKVSADGSIDTHSNVDLTGLATNDILQYDGSNFVPAQIPAPLVTSVNTQTGAVVLDADDISDSTTVNKFATQVQLDQIATNSSDISTNASSIVTNAGDIATNASDISTNASDIAQEVSDRTAADSAIQSQVTLNNAKVSADGSINTHSDVNLTGLTDGDVLQYNGGTGDFEPVPVAPAPVDSVNGQTGAVVLDSDDIDDSSSNHKFASQAQLDQIATNEADIAQEIIDRTGADAFIQGQVTANNAKVSADGSIDTHSDVDTSTAPPTSNAILQYDGTNWVPSNATTSPITYTQTYWCENNNNSTNEYLSWGNGVSSGTAGLVLSEDCTIQVITFKSEFVGNASYTIELDGAIVQTLIVTTSNNQTFSGLNIAYTAGQVLNVRRISGASSAGTVQASITAEFELNVSTLQGPQGPAGADGIVQFRAGSGAPASAAFGNDGDFYINNDNGDYYIKDSGVWLLQGNLVPSGSTQTLKYRKSYVAERGGSSTGKLALGNGSSADTMGVTVIQDCELVAMGVSTSSNDSGTWEVYVNNISLGAAIAHTGNTSVIEFSSPITLNAGDYLNAEKISGGSAPHTVTFEVEIEINLTGFVGPQGPTGPQGAPGVDGNSSILTGTLPPTNPASPQSLYIQSNGDIYTSGSGTTWNFDFKIPTADEVLETSFSNLVTTNINDSSAGINFSGFSSSRIIDDLGSLIAINSSNIIFISGSSGRYEVYARIYMESNVQRASVGFSWELNGVPNNRYGASGYIRSASQHNESSVETKEIFDISDGDVLTLKCVKLALSGTVTTPAGQSLFVIRRIK